MILLLSGCTSTVVKNAKILTIDKQVSALTPRYLATSKSRIEYYQIGSGTPIVLIPGYATDVSSWNRNFLITLAKYHRLIILNNRNIGGSHNLSHSYSPTDLAQDTDRLIHHLDLKKPAVIGISMGGMIAQQLAVIDQKNISHLILINTAIAGKRACRPNISVQKSMLSLPKHQFGFYLLALDLFFPRSWKLPMACALITDRFQPQHLAAMNWNNLQAVIKQQQGLIWSWFNDEATAKKISQLSLPSLILNGKEDQVIPPINSTILANTLRHARLVTWKQGGHGMIYQYPQAIAKQINQFLVST